MVTVALHPRHLILTTIVNGLKMKSETIFFEEENHYLRAHIYQQSVIESVHEYFKSQKNPHDTELISKINRNLQSSLIYLYS